MGSWELCSQMNTTPMIGFVKLSGSGNDFICIDDRNGCFDAILGSQDRLSHFVRSLCHRGTGVGADGVIFATAPQVENVADLGARFFEADGSEAELCGNGTGCFAHWVIAAGFVPDREVRILTSAGVVLAQNCDGAYVRVCIPDPENMQTDLEVDLCGQTWKCNYIVVGIPHAVTYVDDLGDLDVPCLGRQIRHHDRFAPKGVNANFVQILGPGKIALRTYEYGVEGETLACGTGSAAAAILTTIRHNWPEPYLSGREPILVHVRSGDVLRVYLTVQEDGSVTDVCLETVVRFVYSGTLHPSLTARALDPTLPV